MSLFVAFGVVALLIATIGVYATTAYGVSRRRGEMNIRVALGAPISQVFTLVIRQSAVPIGVGAAIGGMGALAMGTVVAGLLFQVRPPDPLVMTSIVTLVGGARLLAAASAAPHGCGSIRWKHCERNNLRAEG
jgi:putative ABC transport system permease protein